MLENVSEGINFLQNLRLKLGRGDLESRGGRYVLIIHFYLESGQKMIQFNIQFKVESKIFIQKIIQFKKFKNYLIQKIIHSNWENNPSLRKQ